MNRNAIAFTKMNGSGNDFVVIDNRAGVVTDDGVREWTRKVCRRGLGIGADGVILVEDPQPGGPEVDFHWRYFNADGSDGELCGNGAMCGARFAVAIGLAPNRCRFSTMSGVVSAEVAADPADPRVTIALVDASPVERDLEVAVGGGYRFDRLGIGVPHAVTVVDDADRFLEVGSFHAWGREVRQHAAFAPAGTNVNVIHAIDEHTIRMRTYERGVEAETLACGTGSAASAIVAVARGLVAQPVTVVTSSGSPIVVTFQPDGGGARAIRITGEARFVARGTLDPEGWG